MRGVPFCVGLVLLFCAPCVAHWGSDSYLHLQPQRGELQGRWDIALRDLDQVIGIDGDNDGLIRWGELRVRYEAIATYALSRLRLNADGAPCPTRPTELLVDHHSGGAYAVLRFVARCGRVPRELAVDYRLFFEQDALHRGLFRLGSPPDTQAAVFSTEQPVRHFVIDHRAAEGVFWALLYQGARHILGGFDHVLFLTSLLLATVVRRDAGRWRGVERFVPTLWEVLTIITAFTLAHAVTLTWSALAAVDLPRRFVESAIAVSIVLAAFNNVLPFVRTRIWGLAFVFGLVHGLGFASALSGLFEPGRTLVIALFAFNLGVEVAQLAIAAVLLPAAFAIRHVWLYRRLVLVPGSLVIAGVGLERLWGSVTGGP